MCSLSAQTELSIIKGMHKTILRMLAWRVNQAILFSVLCLVMLGSILALGYTWPQPTADAANGQQTPHQLRLALGKLDAAARTLQDRQTQVHQQLVSASSLQMSLSRIQLEIAQSQFAKAKTDIAALTSSINGWNNQLNLVSHEAVHGTPLPPVAGQQFIPIVLYHDPPPNLAQQLDYLDQHGYTTVDLDQVAAALNGTATLPPRSIVLTFDDGFASQMTAFTLLQQRHMKATFYIINGGPASRWCIGAGRRYGDPLQPPSGCGDAYLTWDQVRQLDHSGLITIGGHTLDHPNLASLSPDEQRHEIIDSKAGIEQEIGHSIRHFAYPYGDYNQTTIDIVRQAGYVTAVTTQPGDYQTPSAPYTLHRIRDTLSLP